MEVCPPAGEQRGKRPLQFGGPETLLPEGAVCQDRSPARPQHRRPARRGLYRGRPLPGGGSRCLSEANGSFQRRLPRLVRRGLYRQHRHADCPAGGGQGPRRQVPGAASAGLDGRRPGGFLLLQVLPGPAERADGPAQRPAGRGPGLPPGHGWLGH